MAKKFTENHEVMFYECDVTGKLTLPMVLNIVINTSESQSEALARGSHYINSLGLGWVITQHEMRVSRLPKAGETIAVTTAATTYNKYFCYRDFWIHDAEGKECVAITSTFVLMDLTTRKMVSVPFEVIEPYESEKITKLQRGTKMLLKTTGESRPYRVRFNDIDGNQHVNNARYLDWMVDCLDYDFLTSHQPTVVNIRFDKELNYSEMIDSQWGFVPEIAETISHHQIYSGETLCAEANISWQ